MNLATATGFFRHLDAGKWADIGQATDCGQTFLEVPEPVGQGRVGDVFDESAHPQGPGQNRRVAVRGAGLEFGEHLPALVKTGHGQVAGPDE